MALTNIQLTQRVEDLESRVGYLTRRLMAQDIQDIGDRRTEEDPAPPVTDTGRAIHQHEQGLRTKALEELARRLVAWDHGRGTTRQARQLEVLVEDAVRLVGPYRVTR